MTGIDANAHGGGLDRHLGGVEHAGDELPDAVAFGRDTELDRPAHGVEHAGIEPGELAALERDGAEPGQRADERCRAAAGAFELGRNDSLPRDRGRRRRRRTSRRRRRRAARSARSPTRHRARWRRRAGRRSGRSPTRR